MKDERQLVKLILKGMKAHRLAIHLFAESHHPPSISSSAFSASRALKTP